MTREATAIDASDMPDVSRLVHEVARTGQARLLQVDGVAALLSPSRPHRRSRRPTKEDLDAARAAVGSWRGLFDIEQLKRDLDEARGSDSHQPDL